jgi:hypothetical protein
MPIAVDSREAPHFVRFNIVGAWPSAEEHIAVRKALVDSGSLTRQTRVLIDVREVTSPGDEHSFAQGSAGMVTRVQACLVASPMQAQLARLYRLAVGAKTMVQIFDNERDATEWLWNADPEW